MLFRSQDENPARRGVGGNRVLNVFGKVFVVTCLGDRWYKDLPLDDMPVPRDANRTMSPVLKFFLSHSAWLGRLGFGASFLGLQAGHFVNANGVRIQLVIKLWRVQIGLANQLDLLLKQFGILLRRVTPILAFVRPEIDCSKDSIHVICGNGIHQATLL